MSDKIYGAPPVDLGLIDLSPVEMMAWLYCPVKLANQHEWQIRIPDNLKQFGRIIKAVVDDMRNTDGLIYVSYIYVTAKTLWVTADNPGNRPGWHCDGFMTDDLNYVWSDRNGTLFCEPKELVSFTQDDRASLAEMEAVAEPDTAHHRVYPNKHLLRLDQSVLHRVADVKEAGMRSFVKISVSRQLYNLAGNSINHAYPPLGGYVTRSTERNQPTFEKA